MKPSFELIYNFAQVLFLHCKQKIKVLEWGRGTGKSTILGRDIVDVVYELPRSTGVMVAQSYVQITQRTLPSTKSGLEQHGIFEGIHYFVGKKPPKSWNWPTPYEAPLDYNNCIIFWNGTIMIFISQDGGAASGRGLNVDWVIGDEAALLEEEKFNTDVLLTNRGNLYRLAEYPDGTSRLYKDCPRHHSVTLATSTPITANGRWILKYEQASLLNPDKVAFIRASAEVNRDNLGDEYFENAKATMPEFLYDAEVRNIRITQIKDGFYPLLNENKHTYSSFNNAYYSQLISTKKADCSGDSDILPNQPLILGIDWGANINCLVVCQDQGSEFKVLKSLFVKYPKIIDHLIEDEFAPYYVAHPTKIIHLWYDPTGNNHQANSKLTYAQQVKQLLTNKGWQVNLMTQWGNQELHDTKYRLYINILKEVDPKYPLLRINKPNCTELWVSMINSGAKQGLKESIKKDKSSERKKGFAQEHATHFGDALDVVMVGMFLPRLLTSTNTHTPEVSIR